MKNFIFLLSFCMIITTVFSCKKDNNLKPEKQEIDIQYSNSINEFNYDVEVFDNLLSFKSFEEFQNALTKLSNTEGGYYTPEAIANWQERIGFKSMGVKYQSAMNEFENVENAVAYDQFLLNHPDIKMSDDSEVDAVELPVAYIQLAYLLSEEGKVIIDDNLHMFTDKHQIIVMDNDPDKLQVALDNLESNETLGIYVLPYILDEVVSSDASSVSERTGGCGTGSNNQKQSGSKKVVSEITLIATASPRGFLNGGGWDYFVDAIFKGKSEKKNWRGQWKKYSTWMYYYHHYSVCATVNGNTSNPDRKYTHYPSNPTSGYTYHQRLVSGYSISNTAPIMSAAFNFWKHKVFNNHDNIKLQVWCY